MSIQQSGQVTELSLFDQAIALENLTGEMLKGQAVKTITRDKLSKFEEAIRALSKKVIELEVGEKSYPQDQLKGIFESDKAIKTALEGLKEIRQTILEVDSSRNFIVKFFLSVIARFERKTYLEVSDPIKLSVSDDVHNIGNKVFAKYLHDATASYKFDKEKPIVVTKKDGEKKYDNVETMTDAFAMIPEKKSELGMIQGFVQAAATAARKGGEELGAVVKGYTPTVAAGMKTGAEAAARGALWVAVEGAKGGAKATGWGVQKLWNWATTPSPAPIEETRTSSQSPPVAKAPTTLAAAVEVPKSAPQPVQAPDVSLPKSVVPPAMTAPVSQSEPKLPPVVVDPPTVLHAAAAQPRGPASLIKAQAAAVKVPVAASSEQQEYVSVRPDLSAEPLPEARAYWEKLKVTIDINSPVRLLLASWTKEIVKYKLEVLKNFLENGETVTLICPDTNDGCFLYEIKRNLDGSFQKIEKKIVLNQGFFGGVKGVKLISPKTGVSSPKSDADWMEEGRDYTIQEFETLMNVEKRVFLSVLESKSALASAPASPPIVQASTTPVAVKTPVAAASVQQMGTPKRPEWLDKEFEGLGLAADNFATLARVFEGTIKIEGWKHTLVKGLGVQSVKSTQAAPENKTNFEINKKEILEQIQKLPIEEQFWLYELASGSNVFGKGDDTAKGRATNSLYLVLEKSLKIKENRASLKAYLDGDQHYGHEPLVKKVRDEMASIEAVGT